MKIEVVKRPSKRLLDMICQWNSGLTIARREGDCRIWWSEPADKAVR